MIVYCLTNSRTNKAYIGVTSDLDRRLRQHRLNNSAIGAALRLHGLEAFSVEVLFQGSREECLAEEVRLIAERGTLAPGGYNLSIGGEGVVDPSPEVRATLSKAVKSALSKPERRQKMSAKARERSQDPAWRAERSSIAKQQWEDEERRDQTRQRMSDAAKARWANGVYGERG